MKEKLCEQCENCIYLENGDMICDVNDELIYEDFQPTDKNMWCEMENFVERS